jgi:hypothetical protein
MQAVTNPDPKFHTRRLGAQLDELVTHLREDAEQVNEPKAQALFETAAEVVLGLRTAFKHYEEGGEQAMKTTQR